MQPLSSEDQEELETVLHSLRHFALSDIKKISNGDNVIASFILCSCFIDQLGGIAEGLNATGETFRSFANSYLPMYDSVKLWKDLRCKLVHNYSLGESYALVRNLPNEHKAVKDGITILNIENFVDDLETGFNQFVTDVRSNPDKGRTVISLFVPRNGNPEATGIIGGKQI